MAERIVSWKAIADFATVSREARKTEQSLESLRRKQEQINRESSNVGRSAGTTQQATRNMEQLATATDKAASASTRNASAQQKQVTALRQQEQASKGAAAGLEAVSKFQSDLSRTAEQAARSTRQHATEHENLARSTTRTARATAQARDEFGRFTSAARGAQEETRRTGSEVTLLERALGRLRKSFNDAGSGAGLLRGALYGIGIPAVISGIVTLGPLVSALGAGFVGLAGAIAPAAGALATLPGLLAAAGGGIGTLLLGFAGIGGALKAYGQQQKNATKAAQTQASTQRKTATATANAARQITQAERGVASAHDQVKAAQKGVTDARKAAAAQIDQLRKSLKSLALEEEGASLSLEEARNRLAQVNVDPGSTSLERRQAALAVKEAEARLGDVKDSQAQNAKDLRTAQKKGIEGSDQVIAAKKAEAQATQSLADAQQSLADARKKADPAEIALSTGAAAKATDLYAEAMAKLTPEAQAVVRQLLKMKPLLDKIRATAQKGMMPGVLSFLKDATRLFPQVNGFVGTAARSFGDFFARVGAGISSGGGLSKLGLILASTNKIIDYGLDAFYNLGVTLVNIVIAARPLTEWLARTIRNWTRFWAAASGSASGQKKLTGFFESTRRVLSVLGRIFRNVGKALYNMGKATAGLGRWMLDSFEKITKGWADWTASVEGQNALKDWADRAKPILTAFALLIRDLAVGLSELGANMDTAGFIDQVRTQLLPALLQMVGALSDPAFLSAVITLATTLADLVTALAEGGATGGLKIFVDTLNAIASAVLWLIQNVPGLTQVIAILLGGLAAFKAVSTLSKLLGIPAAITEAKNLYAWLKKLKPVKPVEEGKPKAGAPKPKPGGPLRGAPGGAGKGLEKTVPLLERIAPALSGLLPLLGTLAGPIAFIALMFAGLALQIWGYISLVKKLQPLWAKEFGWLADFWNKTLLPAIQGAWNAIVGFLGPVLSAVWRVISFTFRLIVAVVQVAWDTIVALTKIAWGLFVLFVVRPLQYLWGYIKQWAAALWSFLQSAFETAVALVKIAWGMFYQAFIQPVIDAYNWVKAKLTEFGLWLSGKWREFVAGVQKIWGLVKDKIIDPIRLALEPLRQWLNRIWASVKEKLQPVIEWLKTKWAAIKEFFVAPVRDAWRRISDFLDKIKTKIDGWIGKIRDALAPLKDVFSKAFSSLKKVVSDPIQWVVDVINKNLIGPYRNLATTFNLPFKDIKDIEWTVPKLQHGGRVPGREDPHHRDNVLGVSKSGVPVARIEPGEFVMPRSKKRYFPLLEAIRTGRQNIEGFGLKDGGVANPEGRVYMDGEPLTRISAAQIKLAESLSRTNMRVMQGSWQAPSSYSGSSHTGPGVADTSPGNFNMQSWLRKVGFAAWGRNFPGAKTAGSGAHVHSVSLVDPGSKNNAQARAYRAGGDGLGGRDYGPRPSPIPGLMALLGPIAAGLSLSAGAGGAFQAVVSVWSKLKDAFAGALDRFKEIGDDPTGQLVKAIATNVMNGMLKIGKAQDATGGGAAAGAATGGPAPKGSNREIGKALLLKAGFAANQWSPLDKLWTKESGWRTTAKNPSSGAYGIPQALPGSKMASAGGDWRTNPATQIKWGLGYIKSRYGSPAKAWAHSQRTNWYARGTNAAKRGMAVVGEEGPELVYMKGGERVVSAPNTAQSLGSLPGYSTGGVVNGVRPGAKGDWVKALQTAMKQTANGTWGSGLTSALQKGDGKLAIPSTKGWSKTRLKSWTVWVKALEYVLGLTQDGKWGSEVTSPLKHILAHAFGWQVGTHGHGMYDVRGTTGPKATGAWAPLGDAEKAIVAQIRANALNREFDGLVARFQGWALTSLVRKMGDLGTADGLILARTFGASYTQAKAYDEQLALDYARTDARSGGDSSAAKLNLLVSAIANSPDTSPMGLQAAAKAISASLDATAEIYDQIRTSAAWTGIAPSKRSRFEGDVERFRRLFVFAGGGTVPGSGRGDKVHALLEPGEFVLRRAAVSALTRDFGMGALHRANHADRMAGGGFVAGGIGLPAFTPNVSVYRNGSRTTTGGTRTVTNTFNTVINNPTLEDGAVSVQKRVTRIAQLGLLNGDDR